MAAKIRPPLPHLGRGRARREGSRRMKTIRLTAAQAMVRYLARQLNEDGQPLPRRLLGDLRPRQRRRHRRGAPRRRRRTSRPGAATTSRRMAHAAIAYAKALNRKRAMAVTTSIGPGALNMVTAAALAHVNRLPVLLIPGDVFANRAPRPGAAAGRGLRRRHRLGQRRLPPGQPLLRPHHPARAAADRAAPRLRAP